MESQYRSKCKYIKENTSYHISKIMKTKRKRNILKEVSEKRLILKLTVMRQLAFHRTQLKVEDYGIMV